MYIYIHINIMLLLYTYIYIYICVARNLCKHGHVACKSANANQAFERSGTIHSDHGCGCGQDGTKFDKHEAMLQC